MPVFVLWPTVERKLHDEPGDEGPGSRLIWPMPRPWRPELGRFQALDFCDLPARCVPTSRSLVQFKSRNPVAARRHPRVGGRQRHPQEAHRFRKGDVVLQQADRQMRKIVAVRDDRRNGSTARDDLEISKLHFERPPFELGCRQTRNAAKPCLSAARSNVTIHGETVLAKLFDRNGPRGWGPDIDLPEQTMRLVAGTVLEIEAILPPDAVVRPDFLGVRRPPSGVGCLHARNAI